MTALRARVRDFAYRRVGGTALILVYHRVVDLERDPQLLAVSPASFEAQMSILAENCRVISLDRLLAGLRRRIVPDGSVVVTFDDGYSDNLTNAEPILAAHGVPATVFVSSGYVEARREFWWDELERIVLGPGTLPATVELRTSARDFSERLTGDLSYSPEQARDDSAWNVLAATASPRQDLYRRLAAFMRPLPVADRETALRQLRALARVDPAAGDPGHTPRPTHRQLTPEEVSTLDASPVVDVGAHSLNHTLLSGRTLREQRDEIVGDRDALGVMCRRQVRTFSYPYGGLDDYTGDTMEIVRGAGFAGACSNHLGVVKPWTDRFRLPRNTVRDWDASTFAAKVEGWFREQA